MIATEAISQDRGADEARALRRATKTNQRKPDASERKTMSVTARSGLRKVPRGSCQSVGPYLVARRNKSDATVVTPTRIAGIATCATRLPFATSQTQIIAREEKEPVKKQQ
jgi:hypothetical protein